MYEREKERESWLWDLYRDRRSSIGIYSREQSKLDADSLVEKKSEQIEKKKMLGQDLTEGIRILKVSINGRLGHINMLSVSCTFPGVLSTNLYLLRLGLKIQRARYQKKTVIEVDSFTFLLLL